ncbi:hypothetical protein Tsubulata_037135 [Turnera subulata]|uniref:Knottins-like domain-containing protein n=1 Tax=Turnera subulata TaxID=218843 RepID=A0A9Q0GGM5_9ROSI|nr:hypothetical protein Tsubulata_037135 [Turnera subulata]
MFLTKNQKLKKMAKPVSGYLVTFALLFAFMLVLASFEMPVAEARVCKKRSSSFTGFCGNNSKCSTKCKRVEHAKFGACHWDFPGFACFCYYC